MEDKVEEKKFIPPSFDECKIKNEAYRIMRREWMRLMGNDKKVDGTPI